MSTRISMGSHNSDHIRLIAFIGDESKIFWNGKVIEFSDKCKDEKWDEITIVRLKSTSEVLSISSFFASPKKDQKRAFDSSKAVRATRQSRSNAIQVVWQATDVNALNPFCLFTDPHFATWIRLTQWTLFYEFLFAETHNISSFVSVVVLKFVQNKKWSPMKRNHLFRLNNARFI